jgi:hypothetical protein
MNRGATPTVVLLLLAACGGGNPLGNAPDIANPPGESGQSLSFAYFQKCIQPVLVAPLPINQGGVISTNTCASSGCHASATGTGGAFRVEAGAQPASLADTPEAIRATDMYKNFYSAQASTLIGSPDDSRLLAKPLVSGTLHGGGLVFENVDDLNAKLFAYWISRPVPEGQDEFSPAASSMFTPPDPATGTCNID